MDLTSDSSWSVESLTKLSTVLSEFVRLKSLTLRQMYSTESPRNMAVALESVFRGHKLLKVGLRGFHLEGTCEGTFPIPAAPVWWLSKCHFEANDWKELADRSDLELKSLTLNSDSDVGSHTELLEFVKKQASCLETLALQDVSLLPVEICDLVNDFVRFDALKELQVCCEDMNEDSMEKLVNSFMSISSAKKLLCVLSTDGNKKTAHLNKAMFKYCAANRRTPIFLCTKSLYPVPTSTEPVWDE